MVIQPVSYVPIHKDMNHARSAHKIFSHGGRLKFFLDGGGTSLDGVEYPHILTPIQNGPNHPGEGGQENYGLFP